ncbi:hypothetical protein, partial [Sutterella wadsworthensis]|uniref:hypothetical protein n=2 Tax=Sutterella wadsworthensis TaxID=40545 RepID=UPI003A8D7D9A
FLKVREKLQFSTVCILPMSTPFFMPVLNEKLPNRLGQSISCLFLSMAGRTLDRQRKLPETA